MLASPILPVRHQTSIVGRNELNFRVRDGNGWTLALINTNYFNQLPPAKITMKLYPFIRPLSRTNPLGPPQKRSPAFVGKGEGNLRMCSFRQSRKRNGAGFLRRGDPYRIRTDVNGVRGRCLNHLTNGPCTVCLAVHRLVRLHGLEPGTH